MDLHGKKPKNGAVPRDQPGPGNFCRTHIPPSPPRALGAEAGIVLLFYGTTEDRRSVVMAENSQKPTSFFTPLTLSATGRGPWQQWWLVVVVRHLHCDATAKMIRSAITYHILTLPPLATFCVSQCPWWSGSFGFLRHFSDAPRHLTRRIVIAVIFHFMWTEINFTVHEQIDRLPSTSPGLVFCRVRWNQLEGQTTQGVCASAGNTPTTR